MSLTPISFRRSSLLDSSGSVAGTPEADPYTLFNIPISRSPPTPYETARQKQAAQRRKLKAQVALKQSTGTCLGPPLERIVRGHLEKGAPTRNGDGELIDQAKSSKLTGQDRRARSTAQKVSQAVNGTNTQQSSKQGRTTRPVHRGDVNLKQESRVPLSSKRLENTLLRSTSHSMESEKSGTGTSIPEETGNGAVNGTADRRNSNRSSPVPVLCPTETDADDAPLDVAFRIENDAEDAVPSSSKYDNHSEVTHDGETNHTSRFSTPISQSAQNGRLSGADKFTEDGQTPELGDQREMSLDRQIQDLSIELITNDHFVPPEKCPWKSEKVKLKQCSVVIERCEIPSFSKSPQDERPPTVETEKSTKPLKRLGSKKNSSVKRGSSKKARSKQKSSDSPSSRGTSTVEPQIDESVIIAQETEKSSSNSSSPRSPTKSHHLSSPVSFLHISVASLFRRSFSRLEGKHWTSTTCEPCFVRLERMTYEKVVPLVIPEYPVSFDYIFDQWDVEVVSKIGEGSFSEVFRVRPVDFSEKDVGAHEEYVFKVVPVGNHGQPKFEDLLPEMHMTLAGRDLINGEINRAPTFLSLKALHLVQGRYTQEMATACSQFAHENPTEAEHPSPDQRPADQFFIVFFTSYDGVELEQQLPQLSASQKCSIVLQILLGMAAAEAAYDFEHRDLHLSNLVVSDHVNEDGDDKLEFRIEGRSYFVKSFGKKAALIDYGMSRLKVDETLYTSFGLSILEGHNMQRMTYREQFGLVDGKGGYRVARPETNGLWIKFLICKCFRKRPINVRRTSYAAQVNKLYEILSKNPVCARSCVEILAEDRHGGLLTTNELAN